jgi:ATP-dependent RNA helicase RhlE
MLDMGFLAALRQIVATLSRRRQDVALFRNPVRRDHWPFHRSSRDAVRVDVSARQMVAATVIHHVHDVAVERKRDVLTHVLTQHGAGRALVFCRTKRGANRVGEDLGQRGVRLEVVEHPLAVKVDLPLIAESTRTALAVPYRSPRTTRASGVVDVGLRRKLG